MNSITRPRRQERPLAGNRLLSPELWTPAIAEKLRTGAALDEWERTAVAELLERVAGQSKTVNRRGVKKKYSERFDHGIFVFVESFAKVQKAPLTRDGAFAGVAKLWITWDGFVLSESIVEKAFHRARRRLKGALARPGSKVQRWSNAGI